MTNEKIKEIIKDYKYGKPTNTKSVKELEKGLTEDTVREISKLKNEPEWMLELRLKAYDVFLKAPLPNFGPNLDFIDFNDYKYYIKSTDKVARDWDSVPIEIKKTFDMIGIPEAEKKFLAGVSTQFESEAVYGSVIRELKEKGVIFCDTDTALKEHPELVREYFGTVVSYNDNKFASLNTAVWSGGSFIYIPKGVKLTKPLQSYFRINSSQMGQFERTLIIVEEDASVNYVEGCTAPIYSEDSLHAAIVEIVVKDGAYARYSTIQNWSTNILNLVTKRAVCYKNATMEWIDGNMGSGLNMKYPACILKGEGSKGNMISIAFASKNQIQDAGARMIHLAPNTSSTIISKSICQGGGVTNYRGKVYHDKLATNAKSHIECDTIIMDKISKSDTIPFNVIKNASSRIEHEASVSKISDEEIYYLMSRGIKEEDARQMIVMGFFEPFARELPMEYAVELNQLVKLEMEGSIG